MTAQTKCRRRKAAIAADLPADLAEKRCLAPREAAALVGISERLVYQLLSSGEIPSFKITARCRRIRLEDLDAWLDERREGGAA